jgi:hypothetical protein
MPEPGRIAAIHLRDTSVPPAIGDAVGSDE